MHDDHITQRDVNWPFVEELAWKRAGFKNRESLEQAVRNLSVEDKVDMLTELYMKEMAEMLFNKKQEFLLSLGKKTWVDAEESYEYAKKTYKDSEWKVDEAYFHPVCVFNGTHINEMNRIVLKRMKDKREGKKNE